ncbi:group II intron maturase-specific domain-containing protein [Salibacterium qingdaonense]
MCCRGSNIRQVIKKANEITTGWIKCFGIIYMKGYDVCMDRWFRYRMR